MAACSDTIHKNLEAHTTRIFDPSDHLGFRCENGTALVPVAGIGRQKGLSLQSKLLSRIGKGHLFDDNHFERLTFLGDFSSSGWK